MMRPSVLARAAALVAALALPGCAAVSSLSGAATPLDAYTLTPLAGPGDARGSAHVIVDPPTASGAIVTDRILVKPNRLQAAYLPGARWTEPVPVMVQTLLVQSLQASGAFRLVGRQAMGLFPDNTVIGELRAFQAEPGPPEGPAYLIRIALTLTVIREADGALVATRNFEGSAGAPSDAALDIAAAFDAAMGGVLRGAVPWIASATGGGGV
jgi:cholesterol transport system auxiliary component